MKQHIFGRASGARGFIPTASGGAAPVFTAQSAPGGTVAVPYSYTYVATGSVSYAVASGTLPASLSLNTSTGVLSGTPSAAASSTFVISATNAYGTTNSTTQNVTIAASGANPTAPIDFFVTLQGQSAQGSSTFNPSAPPSYNVPNESSISFGWPDAVPGANAIDHYEIQRSTDGGSTWSTPTGGSSISTAAADSQGTRFKDTTPAFPVGSTYGPNGSGIYLPAPGNYLHRLRAADAFGNVSAWVTGAKQYLINGQTGGANTPSPTGPSTGTNNSLKWGGDLSSGYGIQYGVADGTYTYVTQVDMTAAGGGYWLPTTGGNYCTFNQWIQSCNYLYFLMQTSNASALIAMHSEIVGDLPMRPGGAAAPNLIGGTDLNLNKYVAGGTVTAGAWQLYKIPLSDIMVPQSGWSGSSSAVGVLQSDFYKFLWQAQSSTVVKIAQAYFAYS